MAKKNNVMSSPKAPCLFAWLKNPDTQYDENGTYKVTLLFEEDHKFLSKLRDIADQLFVEVKANLKPALAKKAKLEYPIKPDTDAETGDETGLMRVTFKTNATYVDKKTGKIVQKKLKVFDAKNKPMKVCPIVGNGSILNVNFEYKAQFVKGVMYLSLYIQGVRIVELESFSPDGSAMFGEAEEGGFDADEFDGDAPVDGEEDPDDEEEF